MSSDEPPLARQPSAQQPTNMLVDEDSDTDIDTDIDSDVEQDESRTDRKDAAAPTNAKTMQQAVPIATKAKRTTYHLVDLLQRFGKQIYSNETLQLVTSMQHLSSRLIRFAQDKGIRIADKRAAWAEIIKKYVR